MSLLDALWRCLLVNVAYKIEFFVVAFSAFQIKWLSFCEVSPLAALVSKGDDVGIQKSRYMLHFIYFTQTLLLLDPS